MKRFFYRHIYGILGTIIFHLLIIAVFMLIRVSNTYHDMNVALLLELENIIEENTEELPTLPEFMQVYEEEEFWRTIAVNQAAVNREQFDINDYVSKVKEELMAEGEIREENWKEDGSLMNNEKFLEGESRILVENIGEDENRVSAADLANSYSGPTNIAYNVPGRNGTYLHLPIYKCENGGTVVVQIIVNPNGSVISSQIDKDASRDSDPCLEKAAIQAAQRSRFNKSIEAPPRQAGTITYVFLPQN